MSSRMRGEHAGLWPIGHLVGVLSARHPLSGQMRREGRTPGYSGAAAIGMDDAAGGFDLPAVGRALVRALALRREVGAARAVGAQAARGAARGPELRAESVEGGLHLEAHPAVT